MTEANSKITTPIAIIIAGVLIALAIIAAGYFGLFDKNNETVAGANTSLENLREISDDDHVRGSLDKAEVIILEYSDLECPFCKNFHETMNQIIAAYPDGEVAWVFRHFPLDSLHTKARTEAEAAECIAQLVGEDAFWNYIDKIFEATPSNDGLDLALLSQFATEVGADKAKFDTCTTKRQTQKVVETDEENAYASGGNGTPFSIIVLKDGQKIGLGGALPFENLKQIIDSVLTETLE